MTVTASAVTVGTDDGAFLQVTGAGFDNTNTALTAGNLSGVRCTFIRLVPGIPQGIYVALATLSLRTIKSGSPTLRLYAEAADNPGAVVDDADGRARALTTAFVNLPAASITSGGITNVNVTAIMQELVARAGFTNTSNVQWLLRDNGSAAFNICNTSAFEDAVNPEAQLSVTWYTMARTIVNTRSMSASVARKFNPKRSISRVGTFLASVARRQVLGRVLRYQTGRLRAFDSFTRVDSAVSPGNIESGELAGQAWGAGIEGSTWGIIGGQLYRAVKVRSGVVFPGDMLIKNFIISDFDLTVDVLPAQQVSSLIFRHNGQTATALQNFFMIDTMSFTNIIQLSRVDHGPTGAAQFWSAAIPAPGFTMHQVRVIAIGSSIRVFYDGVLKFDIVDSNHAANTYHGFADFGAPNGLGRWDNFSLIEVSGFRAVVTATRTKVVRRLSWSILVAFSASVVARQTLKRAITNTRSTSVTLTRRLGSIRALTRLGTFLGAIARRGAFKRPITRAGSFTATLAFLNLTTQVRPSELEGRLWVVVKDAAGVVLGSGPVYVEALSTVERLDKLGEFAFTLPAEHENASLFAQKRTVELYREGNALPLFAGIIEEINWEE